MIDYKFIKIDRTDYSTKFTIAIYEGDITTENERNPDTGKVEAVTRYRRTKKLGEKQLEDLDNKDLRAFANKEFVKFYPRKKAIDEQK